MQKFFVSKLINKLTCLLVKYFKPALLFLLVFTSCHGNLPKSNLILTDQIIKLTAGQPRQKPIFGAHFNFADPPNEIIFHMVIPEKRPILAQALRDAGVEDLRMSFHGYYSHLSLDKTVKVKQEAKLTNKFPWFPIEVFIAFIKEYNFKTVLGVNVEEGPETAVDLLKRFEKADALNLISSVELGNEPFLSPRPWPPEEYAQKSAEIINALRPFKVKFAVAVIVGKDSNIPTKMTGDEYCERTLATLAPLVDLKNSDDIYGAVHLYSRGVTPVAIKQFNDIVRKYSQMTYQVTEYNIRLSLKGNPHLTNAYAMEFARKLNNLLATPEITGLWIHSFPYHAINYWTDGRQATVIGFMDNKLSSEDLKPGWHLTPAGKVHHFYQSLAWNGEILAFFEENNNQYWVVSSPTQGKLLGVLNDHKEPLETIVGFEDKKVSVQLKAKEIACYEIATGKRVASLHLPD